MRTKYILGVNCTSQVMAAFWLYLCFCLATFLCCSVVGESYKTSSFSGQETESDINFVLYNHDIGNGCRISLNDSDDYLMYSFRAGIPTVFITHGWLVNENDISVVSVKNAYLEVRDVNVVTVGWGNISQNFYFTTSLRVHRVGDVVAKMILKLLNARITTVDYIHLLGHSLGAHVFGVAGGIIRESSYGKVFRITGFDPALPGYRELRDKNDKLDAEDAQFVDMIHTCIGVLGYIFPLGHADFYPNGGDCQQPGCILEHEICGHGRSWKYYVESLHYENHFPSVKCYSYIEYSNNKCKNNSIVYMGVATPQSSRGVYYLRTNGEPMYGRGNPQDP